MFSIYREYEYRAPHQLARHIDCIGLKIRLQQGENASEIYLRAKLKSMICPTHQIMDGDGPSSSTILSLRYEKTFKNYITGKKLELIICCHLFIKL